MGTQKVAAAILACAMVFGGITSASAASISSKSSKEFEGSLWSYNALSNGQFTPLNFDSKNGKWAGDNGKIWVDSKAQAPSENYDAVRTWTSPGDGRVDISGVARKKNGRGDGVKVAIQKGATVLWQETKSGSGEIRPVGVAGISVKKGEQIHFVVNKSGDASYDDTLWSPTVIFTETVEPVPTPEPTPTPIPEPTPATTLSVVSFGAVADDGKDDRAAFVTAAREAKTQGKVLYIPQGEFILSDIFTIDSIRLEGAGPGKTVLVSTNPERGSIDLKGTNVEIRNLKHVYKTTVPRGNGAHEKNSITVRSADGFVIDNISVEQSSTAGIMMAYGSKNGVVSNNTVRNTGADGIHMTTESNNIIVKDNVVMAVGDDGIAAVSYGTSKTPVNHIQILNNRIGELSGARGISVVGGTDVLIEGNNIQDTMMAGVYIAVEGSYDTLNVNNVEVNRNTIHHTGIKSPENHPNVLVYASKGTVDNVTFTGNMITDGAHRGIGVWGGGTINTVTFNSNVLVNKVGAPTTFSNGKIVLNDNVGF